MGIVVQNKKSSLLTGVILLTLSGTSSGSVDADLEVGYVKNENYFVIQEKQPRKIVVGHQSQKLRTIPFTNSTHIDPSLLNLVFKQPPKIGDRGGASATNELPPTFATTVNSKSCPPIKSGEEEVTLCLLPDQQKFSNEQLAAVVNSSDYSASYNVRMFTQALGGNPVHSVDVLARQLKQALNDLDVPEGDIYFDYDHDANCKTDCKTIAVIFISPLK